MSLVLLSAVSLLLLLAAPGSVLADSVAPASPAPAGIAVDGEGNVYVSD